MEKIKFKKRILLKESEGAGALLFSLENDQVYQFTGDASIAVAILKEHSKNHDGITLSNLELELTNVSDGFKKNNYKQECLKELVDELMRLELIDL